MGVSLQIYRVKIGTFIPSVRVKTKTTMEQPGTVINQFKWNYNLVAGLALLYLLTVFIYFNQEQFSFLLRQDHLKLWTNLLFLKTGHL